MDVNVTNSPTNLPALNNSTNTSAILDDDQVNVTSTTVAENFPNTTTTPSEDLNNVATTENITNNSTDNSTDHNTNNTDFQAANVTFKWKLYRKNSNSFESALEVIETAAFDWLHAIIIETMVDDKMIVESMESIDEGTRQAAFFGSLYHGHHLIPSLFLTPHISCFSTGVDCTSPYPDFPICAMTETIIKTLTAPNNLEDSATADYIVEEIKLFVPDFNSNTTMNQDQVRAEFEYPINGTLKMCSRRMP